MKILHWLDEHLEGSLLTVLLSVTSAIVFVQVIARFVFHNSLSWSEEAARYLFIWMIFLGVSYGMKEEAHLKVDALDALLEERGRLVLDIIVTMLSMLFFMILVVYGFDIVLRATRRSAALGLNMKLVYLAPVVGLTLSVFRSVQVIQRKIRAIKALDGKREGGQTQ